MKIFDVLKWENKYDFANYPIEPYLDLVVNQRIYKESMLIMGAWKTKCLCHGNTKIAYISQSNKTYSYTERWNYKSPVARESWETISREDSRIAKEVPTSFQNTEPMIFKNLIKLNGIGFIYAAFVLHCKNPIVFPLIDQHVLRAFNYLESNSDVQVSELQPTWDAYLQYKNFFDRMQREASIEYYRIDRALWALGKWLKKSLPTENIISKDTRICSSDRTLSADKWVISNTLGGKMKPFYWKLNHDGTLIIYRKFKNGVDKKLISLNELFMVNTYMSSNNWVHLANNIAKLKKGTEREGLGSFIVNKLQFNPSEGQIASHIAALHYEADAWTWNRKLRGMMFKSKNTDWRKALVKLYEIKLDK